MSNHTTHQINFLRLGSVATSVIQAIGRPEFEDELCTGVHLEDSWCSSRVRIKVVVNMVPCHGPWKPILGSADPSLPVPRQTKFLSTVSCIADLAMV